MSTPVVLEVALNGVTKKAQNPAAPETHAEIAADALACFAEGAAIVHTHTTRPSPTPQAFAEDYLAAYRPVLAAKPDAILYATVGFGIELGKQIINESGLNVIAADGRSLSIIK